MSNLEKVIKERRHMEGLIQRLPELGMKGKQGKQYLTRVVTGNKPSRVSETLFVAGHAW